MSMSNLNNKNLDRFQMRSNLSTISTDSTTSINSLGKSKRRAPLPPRVATSQKKQLSMNQVSIPEETPSMVQLEQHYNVNHNSVPKNNTELEVRRILPEVPKQPLPPPPPLATQYEPDIVPKPKIASKPPGSVQDHRVKAVKGISFLKGKL